MKYKVFYDQNLKYKFKFVIYKLVTYFIYLKNKCIKLLLKLLYKI